LLQQIQNIVIQNMMDVVAGGCQIQDGCDKSSLRFRPDPENALLRGQCKHDILNHKIIGIFHEGNSFQSERMPLPHLKSLSSMSPLKKSERGFSRQGKQEIDHASQ
jgi:hypothetical protein